MNYIGDLFKINVGGNYFYIDHYLSIKNKMGINSKRIISIINDSFHSQNYEKIDI